MMKRIGIVATLCILVTAAAWAQTQITTGVIRGQVFDQTQAVLPGVTIEVRNVDTNVTRTLVTNAEGRFSALALQPGPYIVTFTLPGFATLIQDGVILTVGQAIDLPITMQLAGAEETITVTGTTLVEVSATDFSTTLNQPPSKRRPFSAANSQTCSR